MITVKNPTQSEMNRCLGNAVGEIISQVLAHSRPGHCLRVSALPEAVMRDLCVSLNADGVGADVVLLIGPRQRPAYPWQVTATRLIELRNAEAHPLLAFIPPGLKAAAEDSFDVSTFVEIDLGDVPSRLQRQLRDQLPEELRRLTDRVIQYLEKVERLITADDVVRYCLTILQNEPTKAVAGGAIYQLHLVPDFALFDVPDRIEQRLDRNATSLRTLIESNLPLLGRIHELKLKANTLQSGLYRFLRGRPLDAVSDWGALIATDPTYRPLSFDRWPFEGEVIDRDRVLLYVDELNLPAREKDQPVGPDNPLYLDVMKASSVRIKWETNPKPAAVKDLTYFRVEIVSTEGAVAWESKNIRNSASRRAYRSRTLKVADFRYQVEDGLYFFRVRAYSESGEILNEEDAEEHPEILRDRHNPEGKRIYESEDVWFWVDEEAPPPAEPQRNVTVNSFLNAQLQAQFAAIDRGDDPLSDKLTPRPEKTGWATAKRKRAEATYNIVYDAQARFTLSVSNLLRRIESETLAHPKTLGRWRLNFSGGETHHSVQPTVRQFRDTGQIPGAFLQARVALFQAIQRGPDASSDVNSDCLTATVDLIRYEDLILAYANAYSDWLAQVQADFDNLAVREEEGRRRTDPIFLDLDIVEVLLTNGSPLPDRVYLLAPTHPVRLLWHLQWARMAQAWIRAVMDARASQPSKLLTATVRRYLRQGLMPINLPPVIRAAHDGYPEGISHFYVEQGPLSLFWSLYVHENGGVRDSRALRACTQRALGIGRQSADAGAVGGIDKAILTQKLLRYLVQHPYVRTLKLNVFNPGDAGLIVNAILGVEKARNKAALLPLRYELRLFTRSAGLDDVGEAVDELLNPERQVSPEADAFAVPSQNHLFPKLRFSRNSLDDFLHQPERYEAHISILHDLFPVDVDLEALKAGRSSFVYGLIQEQVTHFAGDHTHYAWQRQLVPTSCQELPGDPPPSSPPPGRTEGGSSHPLGGKERGLSARLATLLSQVTNLQASVAAGKKVEAIAPTLRLNLAIQDKNLLYQIHAVSDWVFIIDRHLGLEYFDSDVSDDRPAYLLDFTPEFGGTDTDRLLLTTRSVDEVTRLIRPALEEYDLFIGEGVEVYFLQLLRSLSGRLALKLLSSPNQTAEALGLAMARLFLEQYGLLTDRIVLPLDAHGNLFAEAGQEASLEEEVSLQRGDLLLVTCDLETRTVHFHIIEVKWRADLGDLSAYVALRQQIERQLMQSEEALRLHFDPQLLPVDRVDRQVKTKELVSLLSFYLERSRRYGLVSDQAATVLRPFIESLDKGYRLTCAGAGLIFDFGYEGVTQEEEHAGLVFHRVGRDYIRCLLDNGLRRRALLQAEEKPSTIEEAERQQEKRRRIVRDTSMSGDASYRRVRTHFQPAGVIPPAESLVVSPENQRPTLEGRRPPPEPDVTVEPQQPRPEPESPPRIHAETPPADEVPVEELTVEGLPAPPCDVLLGDTGESCQYGVLGRAAGKIVALDLNGTNTISLFGVQGSGKSYTVGSIIEMATQQFDGINLLSSPLASVIFHYHQSQDYPPEFVSMVEPNSDETQVRALVQEYGARPARLEDVLILTSADKLDQRRAEFPSVSVEPILFSSNELSFKDWRFLMGVGGNQMYMKQINLIMRQLRERMTLETLKREIEDSELSDGQKTIARIRLNFAAQFVDDSRRLADVLRPGQLIIVDLRDEFIDKDEALGLFVVMLNIFANAGRDEGFNKLIVFDEAHKYMDNPDLTGQIVDVIRQMRHQGVSVLIASQDPPSLPNAIIELSSLVILHRFNSPKWLKHVQRSITALANLTPAQMAALRPGDAYVWATKATERVFAQKAVKMRFRPRVTQHGGETKRAV